MTDSARIKILPYSSSTTTFYDFSYNFSENTFPNTFLIERACLFMASTYCKACLSKFGIFVS